jgi:GNAT superfamily N-acetyltransferase
MPITIRPLELRDADEWNILWAGYLEFYETEITKEQTQLTWQRLNDTSFDMHGLVAELDGKVVGIAHYSFTYSSWAASPHLYLEDLFVDPEHRGKGIGKELILALEEPAKARGSEKIYWETHKDNKMAKSLYEGIAELSEFVTYSREVK